MHPCSGRNIGPPPHWHRPPVAERLYRPHGGIEAVALPRRGKRLAHRLAGGGKGIALCISAAQRPDSCDWFLSKARLRDGQRRVPRRRNTSPRYAAADCYIIAWLGAVSNVKRPVTVGPGLPRSPKLRSINTT